VSLLLQADCIPSADDVARGVEQPLIVVELCAARVVERDGDWARAERGMSAEYTLEQDGPDAEAGP